MTIVKGEFGSIYASTEDHFEDLRSDIAEDLLETELVHGARWQQLDVSQSDAHATHELLNATIWYDMPSTIDAAQTYILPDLPWAEGHFQERVAGVPSNPGNWHDKWPYHAGKVDLHQHGGKYDHNYMERIWASRLRPQWNGYRFKTGDLQNVIDLLLADQTTRQAYLPIWFPEDTGAQEGQRVPCTLGYHFIIRDGRLHLQYNIRSCEIYRHFTNDMYMAVRLAQWMAMCMAFGGKKRPKLGQLTMHVVSLHGFVGDVDKIKEFVL